MNKVIVITGSTRGIGLGLATSFLALGQRVVISGRSDQGVKTATAQLLQLGYQQKDIAGIACDVTVYQEVFQLWEKAAAHFGQIDIWINNAGLGQGQQMLWDLPENLISALIKTNLNGAFYGIKVAVKGMMQQGFGSIYNMEGLGSDGRMIKGISLYGTSKYGLYYLTKALAREIGKTAIVVGSIRPGMVLTDLLLEPYRQDPAGWKRVEKVFSILADRVEVVTPWIARRVLANKKNGACISWLTRRRAIGKFILALFQKKTISLD